MSNTQKTQKNNIVRHSSRAISWNVVNDVLDFFAVCFGAKPSNLRLNRYATKRLLVKLEGDVVKLKRLVAYANAIQGDKYSPRINSMIDLERKLINVINYYRRSEQKPNNSAKPNNLDLLE